LLWFSQENLQWSLLFGLASVFIAVALVFSKSRSGIMILVATVVLSVAALGSWRELSDRASERRRLRGLLSLVAAAALVAVLWLGVGPVIARFGETDITSEMRRTFMANTVRMTGDFVWAGAGKGTYVHVYPLYRKVDDGYLLSYAHNDYLEVTAENGVIAGGCLIVAGFWLFGHLAGRWRQRRNNFAKGVGLGAILGILALLIHGFTDFNLQIPANAVYFVGFVALAVNVVTGRRREADAAEAGGWGEAASAGPVGTAGAAGNGREAGEGRGRRGAGGRELRTAAAGVAAVAMLVFAGREFLGFKYLGLYQEARAGAKSVQSAYPELEGLLRTAASWSSDTAIRKELGRLELEEARAENDSGKSEERDLLCDRAVASYEAVIGRDPIDASAHYEIGMTYLLYNYPLMTYGDKARLYFRKALELAPADSFLNLNILYYYLTAWEGLGDEDRAYAGHQLKKITAADPAFLPQLERRWTEQFGSAEKLKNILGSGLIK
jgi:hypothetical protein